MDEQQRRQVEELLFAEKKAPSLAKRLFFGAFENETAFPFPESSAESKRHDDAFIEKVRHFVETEIDPDKIDRKAEIPSSVIRGLGELGVLGMTIPKQHGGLGMSQTAYLQGRRVDCRQMRIHSLVRQCPPEHRLESAAPLRYTGTAAEVAGPFGPRRAVGRFRPD